MDTAERSKAWFPFAKATNSGGVELFCMGNAGGGASAFAKWPTALSPHVHVHAVHLPGHQERLSEPPFLQIRPLVEGLAKAILPVRDGRFALFGHSMGAFVAFELARLLRQDHRVNPACLVIAACQAPQLPRTDRELHLLPDAELLFAVQQRFGGIAEGLAGNREAMEILLPVLRADLAVVETYQFHQAAPLDCPITVFGGTEDRAVSVAALSAWQAQTRGKFSLRMFPGGHFFLHDNPSPVLRAIAGHLQTFALGGEFQ